MIRGAYRDEALTAAATAAFLSIGYTILQVHRLAADDREHVAALLGLLAPRAGALVLDVGCGLGTIGRIMRELRPDLSFALVNSSASQLAQCPDIDRRILADLHAMPLPAASVDTAMMLYSLRFAVPEAAFIELARVMRPGAPLLIWDAETEDSRRVTETLGYELFPRARVLAAAARAGLVLDFVLTPETTNTDAFLRTVPRDFYDHVFAGVHPVAYRFTKGSRP